MVAWAVDIEGKDIIMFTKTIQDYGVQKAKVQKCRIQKLSKYSLLWIFV